MTRSRIVHGDCRLIIPTLAAESIAAVITDPPYGTENERDGYGRRQNYGGIGRKIEGDSDLAALTGMLGELPRVLRTPAWVAVFCSPKRHMETAATMELSGFPVAGEVVWDKASPGLGGGIRYQHETILLCKHGKATGLSSLFSVLRHHVSRTNRDMRHPHEKPVALMMDIVNYCSREHDTILDPFAGSGSTLVACEKSGRIGIGTELGLNWVDLARRRLMETKMPLFDDSDLFSVVAS